MKVKLIIIVLGMLILAFTPADKSVETFAEEIFDVFKKGDTNSFKQMLLTQEAFLSALQNTDSMTIKRERYIQVCKTEGFDSIIKDFSDKSIDSFNELICYANSENIDLSKAKFIDYNYSVLKKDPFFDHYYGSITFEFNNQKYFIVIKDIVLLEEKFYLAEYSCTEVFLRDE